MFAGTFSNPGLERGRLKFRLCHKIIIARYLALDAWKCPPGAPLTVQEWLQGGIPPPQMTDGLCAPWWDGTLHQKYFIVFFLILHPNLTPPVGEELCLPGHGRGATGAGWPPMARLTPIENSAYGMGRETGKLPLVCTLLTIR